jgi:hypothetical protein
MHESGTVPTTSTVPPPTTVATTPATTLVGPDGATGLFATPSIAGYLGTRAGDVTAAVEDLNTGTLSLWRPGTSENTASIVKVDILATLLQQSQSSGRPLSGSEEELAETMIEQSDDDSASSLWDQIGEQNGLGAFNHLLGLTGTVGGADGYWGNTMTTAADQVHLLDALVAPNPLLTTASRDYEIGLMENVDADQAWGISDGPLPGVTVAIKNGWLPLEADDWQVNSIGWVDGDGRNYLVAVLTESDGTESYGIDTIEGLSSLIWAQLGT